MRRYAAATAAGLSLTAALAAPAAATDGGEPAWTPVGYGTYDYAAGARCAFPVHLEPVVDEVLVKRVASYPDGSPKTELYKGALIMRVTNVDTGASYDADASGRSRVTYGTDGSETWYAEGPVLLGFAEGLGNLPRGEYVIDGTYTVDFAADGYRTVTWIGATQSLIDVCDRIA